MKPAQNRSQKGSLNWITITEINTPFLEREIAKYKMPTFCLFIRFLVKTKLPLFVFQKNLRMIMMMTLILESAIVMRW